MTPLSVGSARSKVHEALFDLTSKPRDGAYRAVAVGGPCVVAPATADLLAKMAGAGG